MIRLLLDQGLPRRAVAELNEAGVDTAHVAELGMSRAPDAAILDEATRTERVVVTLDSDFAQLVATGGLARPSIVHLRLQGLAVRRTGTLLVALLAEVAAELEAGAIVSVGEAGYRVRRIPLRRATKGDQ